MLLFVHHSGSDCFSCGSFLGFRPAVDGKSEKWIMKSSRKIMQRGHPARQAGPAGGSQALDKLTGERQNDDMVGAAPRL
jgi:hypothetical protein